MPPLLALPPMTSTQMAVAIVVLVLVILPNYIAIWQSFHREFPSPLERMFWFLLAIFVPLLGGLVFLVWGRKRGRKPS